MASAVLHVDSAGAYIKDSGFELFSMSLRVYQLPENWRAIVAVLALAMVLHGLSRWLIYGLQQGKSPFAQRAQALLNIPPGHKLGELTWLHWALMLSLWCSVGLVVLHLLGMQQVASDVLVRLSSAGVSIAGVTIVPVRIVFGVVVMVLLFAASRFLRGVLETKLKSHRSMDSAASESIATIVGYVGFVIALLSGLGLAGFNLTNLALVAGALSVGIGFGLQNIVNNFVSGLILLTERPVRRGDYVRVGSVEGEVRKIHIRATEIETLDRVSVVVPNSELIASPVHNWRLRDPYIRVVITIGVAYGSDVRKVQALLVKVGVDHESTLPNSTPGVPDTHVYFTGFGASSLDFELRTFIRDVNKRGLVASDLRFAIDQAFRENSISIPFPQTDVWMRKHDGPE